MESRLCCGYARQPDGLDPHNHIARSIRHWAGIARSCLKTGNTQNWQWNQRKLFTIAYTQRGVEDTKKEIHHQSASSANRPWALWALGPAISWRIPNSPWPPSAQHPPIPGKFPGHGKASDEFLPAADRMQGVRGPPSLRRPESVMARASGENTNYYSLTCATIALANSEAYS